MNRSADYAIQGFLYQFNKTILEILRTTDDSVVTVEGIIEDIDIAGSSGVKAIQCKYHEEQHEFALSLLYKPILQMMKNYCDNKQEGVNYVLYAYFPNKPCKESLNITSQDIKAILKSKDKNLRQYTETLKGKIKADEFLKHLTVEFGKSFNALVADVCSALKENGIPVDDVDTLAYPNSIQIIANLSTKHDAKSRRITRRQLISEIQKIRKTAISKWTLSLKSYRKIIEARRKQLKANLDKNARTRYFLLDRSSIDNFMSEIVLFISEFLDKYHFKTAHIKTPLFCLDCSEEEFRDIQLRLYQKGIISIDGYIAGYFDERLLFREPMTRKVGRGVEREFAIRIIRYNTNIAIMNKHKCDDLFVICNNTKYDKITLKDINVEHLSVHNFKEIKYILGVSNAYD